MQPRSRAREVAIQAMHLWPALDNNALIAVVLIDEAGIDDDAKAWIATRRLLDAESALDKLVAEHAPLAAKIRGAKQWADVATYARADTRRPDVGEGRPRVPRQALTGAADRTDGGGRYRARRGTGSAAWTSIAFASVIREEP